MEEITIKDYYKYRSTVGTLSEFIINEEETLYNPTVNNKHDKLFRDLLLNRKEIAQILNKFFSFRKEVILSDLELYNSSFVTQTYQSQESDVVYKLKDRNIFFLIEHQSYVDYSMSYRILKYSLEIIRNAIDLEELQKEDYKYPKVIPIVIYTGSKKWNSAIEYQTIEDKIMGYQENNINSKYNLIDVNNYTKKELLEDKSMISKMLAIEKCNSKQELMESLEYIIDNLEYENDKRKMKRIVQYILGQIIGKEEVQRFLKMLENKEEVIGMLAENLMKEKMEIIRRAKIDGKKEGLKEGREEAKAEMLCILIKNMLKANETEEKILNYLEISKQQFEEIKNSIKNQ